ncbi:MAG: hypothetical protein U9N77_07070 [Thermodesulfobacteriota bacterium]|nr:hypothetical protein [Thermodesulfobacteriota bacterium]
MNQLVMPSDTDIVPLIERAVMGVREDMRDNPYILEAIRVLPVQGYRSVIGAFWNAVVDDLRNKIIFRSISLFNKEIGHPSFPALHFMKLKCVFEGQKNFF